MRSGAQARAAVANSASGVRTTGEATRAGADGEFQGHRWWRPTATGGGEEGDEGSQGPVDVQRRARGSRSGERQEGDADKVTASGNGATSGQFGARARRRRR